MDTSLHLVSDLDGTWIPTEERLKDLRQLEFFLSEVHGLILTFATGRTLHSALTAISGSIALWPNHFITDVGTASYHRHGKRWFEDVEYGRMVDGLWDPKAAERVAQHLPNGICRQSGLHPRRRLALEMMPGYDLSRSTEALRTHLARAWFPADVLPSNACCLDVLPKGVNKGTAVAFLERRIPTPSLLVVCGDSENDLGMFHKADVAVVMAGSPLTDDQLGYPGPRIIHPAGRGPAGILEALLQLQSWEPHEQGPGRLVEPRPIRGHAGRGE